MLLATLKRGLVSCCVSFEAACDIKEGTDLRDLTVRTQPGLRRNRFLRLCPGVQLD